MSTPNGILYNAPNSQRVRLPLEEVRARVLILDVSARVTLKQIYSNPSAHPTARAKYCFPVPASAAVCAFEMTRASDGRRIQAVARERKHAQEDFERALAAGEDAGLLEYVTDDVGSIPAHDQVSVQIVYVMSLMNEESASDVRLHLPMHIAERYGKLPAGVADASHPPSAVRVRITLDILCRGKLTSVKSPSHADQVRIRPYQTDRGRASRRRVSAKYRSLDFLDRDFILIVRAEGLGESRCFAELGRHPTDSTLRTLALQLVLVPKVPLAPSETREFIFLVDRSGSMDGDRIETAKKTLQVLLLMLPAQGTYFNVFSFGGHSDSLWLRSRPYDEGTLDEATDHVRAMRANYGGTHIREALENIFAARQENHPTSIFVLTDGGAYDTDASVQTVQDAVASAPPHARLNIFCLGIGDSVSTDMCEAGDGHVRGGRRHLSESYHRRGDPHAFGASPLLLLSYRAIVQRQEEDRPIGGGGEVGKTHLCSSRSQRLQPRRQMSQRAVVPSTSPLLLLAFQEGLQGGGGERSGSHSPRLSTLRLPCTEGASLSVPRGASLRERRRTSVLLVGERSGREGWTTHPNCRQYEQQASRRRRIDAPHLFREMHKTLRLSALATFDAGLLLLCVAPTMKEGMRDR
ncbi:von Willebrand factor type A domain-containing protein [Schizophyllum amplum]|uniref:von Willebrand factor type A domain-containing protein n=1 Tax=Schizophyllum amplum TaxID=97359 RepID=A0A550CDH2_9AGAR|nr:von Willebrand factor type A domain-containing protein [Auriculariopsis ampla]